MDGPVEITTTLTVEDRIEAGLWSVRQVAGDRRWTNFVWGLVAILGGSVFGLLSGWVGGSASLLDVLRALPAILRTPYPWLIALLLAALVTRYAFYDRLLRRRVARWVLADQGVEVVTFLYRVDPSGLTVEDATGDVHVARASLTALDETPEAFYVRSGGGLLSTLIVPKHDLAPTLQDRFRSALSAMIGAAPDAATLEPPVSVAGAGALVLRYDQTEAEFEAGLWQTYNTPAARRRRALLTVAVVIGLALVVPAFALLDWLLDPDPDALATLFTQARQEFWKGALVAVAIGAGAWSVTQRLIRKQAHTLAAAQAGGRRQPAAFTLGAGGFVSSIAGTVWRYGWQNVRSYSEGTEHVFLKLRFGQIIALPRRAFGADTLATLRRLVAEHGPGARGQGLG